MGEGHGEGEALYFSRQRDFNGNFLSEDCRQVTRVGLEPIDVGDILMQVDCTDRVCEG